MNNIFVNFTNHPSELWGSAQRAAAEQYGTIVDIPFPAVGAGWTREEVYQAAALSAEEILRKEPAAVLCQGEFCLAYHVISMLKESGVTVLAACSERRAITNGMRKEVVFSFEQFREY